MAHRARKLPRNHQRRSGRSLRIVCRNVSDLKLDPANPRFHTPKQINQIARSIETFGFNVPVLINSKGEVIAGHGRLLACRLLGITQVPTICLEHLNGLQIRAFMIADNRLTENSEWDKQLLAEQVKFLSEVELDFSLETIGFEMAEIDMMIEGLAPGMSGKDDPADTIPEMPEKLRICRGGDRWRLDRHRIYCGDARDECGYETLFGNELASMVFADSPYNVPIVGHACGLGRVQHQDFQMASGEMSKGEFTDFLKQAMARAAAYSKKGSIHYICMDWRHTGEVLAAGEKVYSELKNLCIWAKENAGMGSLYRSQHELIFVFKNGNQPHRNNVQLGQFGRYRSNVWHYPGVNSFSRKTEEGNLLELHPTVKPVALVADAILDCSSRNDIVLDPFLGSGTTIIAAERTGRIGYGIESTPFTWTPQSGGGGL